MGQDTTQIGVDGYTEDAPPQRPVSISKPIFPADAQAVQQGTVQSAYSPLYTGYRYYSDAYTRFSLKEGRTITARFCFSLLSHSTAWCAALTLRSIRFRK